jgi:hypothetical protein
VGYKGEIYTPNGDFDGTLSTFVHEIVEIITNPLKNAYWDSLGFENGDKCNLNPKLAKFEGNKTSGVIYNMILDGKKFLIQAPFDNDEVTCLGRIWNEDYIKRDHPAD